jgi:multidrug efflux pump subunit AcrB
MKISEFSVRHSLFVNLCSLIIIIGGLFSLFTLKKEAFPSVSYNVVRVTTSFRGASAEKVERLLTSPLEKELREVDNIDEIVSSSYEGLSTIIIKISSDVKDIRKVVNDIQQAVDKVTDLPEDVDEKPTVTEITSDEFPVIKVSVSGSMDEFTLREYADTLRTLLEDINGVSAVERSGWRDEEYWVEPDLNTMKKYHISFRELVDSLRSQNVDIPGGKQEYSGKELIVKVKGELKRKEDIENTVIRSNDLGHWIKVKDVANVRHTFSDDIIINKAFGTRAIILTVIKKKKGDIIRIVDEVHKTIKRFKEGAPPELKIGTFYDLSYYVNRRLNVLRSNGIIGFIFVIIVLFVFLPPIPAFMTALGIPIAFFVTLWIMSTLGLTINLITMFGLVMVLGIIVDDSIIISENVFRYIEKGLKPPEAAIVGTNEVYRPVLATVITTMVAFSPLMFMQGLIGKFVRYIPFVVIIALMASLIEAFFVLPSHLADFSKPLKKGFSPKDKDSWFYRFRIFYRKVLIKAINKRYKVIGVVSVLFIFSLIVAKFFMPFVLFSPHGVEQFSIMLEAEPDTNLYRTNEFISQVEKIVDTLPSKYLRAYETIIGKLMERRAYDPNVKQGNNFAQINVYLTAPSQRRKSAEEIIAMIRPRIEALFNTLREKGVEKLYFHRLRPGPAIGKPIDVKVQGEDFKKMLPIIAEIKQFLSSLEGVRDISDSYNLGSQEIHILINEEKAQKAFLTNTNIAFAIRAAFSGAVATTIKREKAEKEIRILVRLPRKERNNPEVFNKILVSNKFGNLIPLKEVVSFKKVRTLRTIKHIDGKRFISVTAEVDNKRMTSMKANTLLKKKFSDIPLRYPGYSLKFGGEEEETATSLKSLLRAFIIAVCLIFLILATQFNSLLQPFIVMLTIPLGVIGVIVAFLLHQEPLGFFAIMGFVGLTGVVVNDSIVLVDFINKRRDKTSLREAVIEAGTLRLRPVLLTTITTVCGLATVAYGIGGLDPFLRPMALAISWGLMFATLFTLIVIPCTYLIIEDIKGLYCFKQ